MNFKTKEERLQAKIKRKKDKEGKLILKAKKKEVMIISVKV